MSRRTSVRLAVGLLAVHAALLAWGALRHSPTWDEVAHLPAGISHWKFGQFHLYRVNPPLVRMVASLPVLAAKPKTDWTLYGDELITRYEFSVGTHFVKANGKRTFWLFTIARWACIPFSLLGGYICFRWADQLYGDAAGLLALVLWCFSPTVIGNAQMVTPDAGAAAMGLTAGYAFWRWVRAPTWWGAVGAGVFLGLAQLTKMTWIVLLPLWPVLWLVYWGTRRRSSTSPAWWRQTGQMASILALGVLIIDLGYGFEGSFRPLGDYRFVSNTLGGTASADPENISTGNRFAGGWLHALPVPLPENYLLGIDRQRRDFENGIWSYLRGDWRKGGWWYFYLYALAIKVPLGTWGLLILALAAGLFRRAYRVAWRDELILLAPAVMVIVLVSSQTGFSHHLRYVLPAFGFVMVWVGKLARAVALRHARIALPAAAALLWSVGSSLYVYPHSLSYFNELVGGPTGGHRHLASSNTDWGQDLLYLKRWLDDHPQVQPLGLAYDLPLIDPLILDIEYRKPPWQPSPGWYVIGVNRLHDRSGRYAYFLRTDWVDRIGYSMFVYHVTREEANRLREELELPLLPSEPT